MKVLKYLKQKTNCSNYIETPTVKEATHNYGESVEAVACEAALFCLLLHHMTLLDLGKIILMNSMKSNKSSEQHVIGRIQDLV